jgi:hypothetical protein
VYYSGHSEESLNGFNFHTGFTNITKVKYLQTMNLDVIVQQERFKNTGVNGTIFNLGN